MLILVPTRELALQTSAIVKEIGKHTGVQCMVRVEQHPVQGCAPTVIYKTVLLYLSELMYRTVVCRTGRSVFNYISVNPWQMEALLIQCATLRRLSSRWYDCVMNAPGGVYAS